MLFSTFILFILFSFCLSFLVTAKNPTGLMCYNLLRYPNLFDIWLFLFFSYYNTLRNILGNIVLLSCWIVSLRYVPMSTYEQYRLLYQNIKTFI